MWQIVVWCISDLCDRSENQYFISIVPPHCLVSAGSLNIVIMKEPSQGTYKTSALLTFPEELIKFQTWIKSGFCRLRCEELGVLSVCLPPTEPVLWFLRDRALYLKSVRVALCFWRTRWAASGQRSSGGGGGLTEAPFTMCSPSLTLCTRSQARPPFPTHAAAPGSANQYAVIQQDGAFCEFYANE